MWKCPDCRAHGYAGHGYTDAQLLAFHKREGCPRPSGSEAGKDGA